MKKKKPLRLNLMNCRKFLQILRKGTNQLFKIIINGLSRIIVAINAIITLKLNAMHVESMSKHKD